MDKTALDGWSGELRSGVLTLAVLSQLREPQNGANLIRALEKRGLLENPGTLMPLLLRLEKQKLLIGSWDDAEKKAHKYYVLSEKGKEAFYWLNREWQGVVKELQVLIERNGLDDLN